MTKKCKTVVCNKAWTFAQGEPLVEKREYKKLRQYFRNGEHWMEVEHDGKRTTAPSIFFD
jgi:hypothetical protein